jgi:hypothetical protein
MQDSVRIDLDKGVRPMRVTSNASPFRYVGVRSSYTIALFVFVSLLTVCVPCAAASSAAPAEIQGCWNLMTNSQLRITLRFGESSSIAYVKVNESHELEKEYVEFRNQTLVFWHRHIKDDSTHETWVYRCVVAMTGSNVAALRCKTNFVGDSLFPRCSH